MIYLFIQTWGWIFTAGLLGLVIGWLIWGKRNARDSADSARLRRQLEECRATCKELESSDRSQIHGVNLSEDSASIPDLDPAPTPAPEPVPTTAASGMKDDSSSNTSTDSSDANDAEILDSWKPQALPKPDDGADDLKRVKGIGPVIEKTLNELGIYHFRQVGAFTEHNIRWVDNYIAFPGRIQRENWVTQAQELESGGETEFSNRYDKK